MARKKFDKTFNTYVKGLITEASELTHPDDYSLYEKNFVLCRDGGRSRRLGQRAVGGLIPTYETYTLTSSIYPIEFSDGIAPSIVKPELTWQKWQVDEVSLGLLPPKIYRRDAVKYWDYKNTPPESIGVGLLAPTISRKSAVRYLVYDNAEPEQLSIGMLPPAIFRKKVADRFNYRIPEESISVGLLAPTIKRTNT